MSSGLPPSSSFKLAPTSSKSTPKSIASKATDSSVQSSHPGSTIFSVTVVPATSSGEETSTITAHPTSTLSNPVVSTSTDLNGSQIITTPALVTIWSTSTNVNGTIATATAVVANPQADISSASGILHNTGVVAGIFAAVGVVFTSLVVCMAIYIRRRHRYRQHEKWVAGMEAQRDPFRDENLPPAILSVHTNDEDSHWDQKGILTPDGSSHGQTHASIFPAYPMLQDGTFGQPEKPHLQSIDMESPMAPNKARRSWAPSTPSIYPASLSPEDEQVSNNILIVSDINQSIAASPPRPPRSHLRDRGVRTLSSRLPTPPESEHSNHTLSFVSEQRSVHVLVDRKTILDVQSHPITP